MRLFNLKPDEENLIDTFCKDLIGRTADVCSFAILLQSIEEPCSIGLDGKWGTGKTFFVKQCKLVLDSLNTNIPFSKREDSKRIKELYLSKTNNDEENIIPFVTAYYDAWQHDDEEEPVLSLMYEIMKDNYDNYSKANRKSWSDVLSSVAEFVTKRNVGDLVKALKGENIFERQKSNEELDKIIESFLKSFLPEKGNKLVVFIDELDRCSPIYAVRLLERIKHYFCCEDVIFVFSVNFDELQKTVKSFYGEQFDACRYMDRFFDIRMDIPPMDMRKYVETIGLYGQGNMRESVCLEIIKQMNMGMREASRFLQMSKVATYKYTDGNGYEHDRAWSLDNGVAKLIGYSVIVPIAFGLKMTNSSAYDEFITGKNSMWLERIMDADSLHDWITNMLLFDTESYSDVEGKTKVNRKTKIKDMYNAVFVKTYQGSEYQIKIGKATFDKDYKNRILKATALVSPYTDYHV